MNNRKRICLSGNVDINGGIGSGIGRLPIAGTMNGNNRGCNINFGANLIGTTTTTMAASTLTNLTSGQSIFLTSNRHNDDTVEIPANLFLTICGDDNLDESKEFYIETTPTTTITTNHNNNIINNQHQQEFHTQIKQEPTKTITQYRFVNPTKIQSTTRTTAVALTRNLNCITRNQPPPLISTQRSHNPEQYQQQQQHQHTLSSILPANVQLPSGCEIYLVKEYIDPRNNDPARITATTTTTTTTGSSNVIVTNNNELLRNLTNGQATIKLEPNIRITTHQNTVGAILPLATTTTTTFTSGTLSTSSLSSSSLSYTTSMTKPYILNQRRLKTPTTITDKTKTIATGNVKPVVENNSSIDSKSNIEDTTKSPLKRSYLLEAYKKRDDKRRATHNEVERRRRDKINSWIFKLKEMLPNEFNASNIISSTSTSSNITNITTGIATNNQEINGGVTVSQRSPTGLGTLCEQLLHTTMPTRKLNDSKSQILIKACEHIRKMQDEIKNLRECLTLSENEVECLRNELNLYKTNESTEDVQNEQLIRQQKDHFKNYQNNPNNVNLNLHLFNNKNNLNGFNSNNSQNKNNNNNNHRNNNNNNLNVNNDMLRIDVSSNMKSSSIINPLRISSTATSLASTPSAAATIVLSPPTSITSSSALSKTQLLALSEPLAGTTICGGDILNVNTNRITSTTSVPTTTTTTATMANDLILNNFLLSKCEEVIEHDDDAVDEDDVNEIDENDNVIDGVSVDDLTN